jgi:hypothetical protein
MTICIWLRLALCVKEDVAMQVINYYAKFYTKRKTVELLKENQKCKQRVDDFLELKNGIIPRNDLLKSQLQVSKVQLSLDKAMT